MSTKVSVTGNEIIMRMDAHSARELAMMLTLVHVEPSDKYARQLDFAADLAEIVEPVPANEGV